MPSFNDVDVSGIIGGLNNGLFSLDKQPTIEFFNAAKTAGTALSKFKVEREIDPYEEARLAAADRSELPQPTDAEILGGSDDPYEAARLDAEERSQLDQPTDAEILGDNADTSAQSSPTAAPVNASNIPEYTPARNPLRYYASYTYNLSLHALTKEDYALINENPGSYVPKNVLIAGAGRRDDATFKRNAKFEDDFYFDNLEMTTIIGMSRESRNSNAIELKFTIVEPYGMTLLERLINAARDLGIENFRAMPYLIQIDFFGYTDEGIAEKLSEITKSIPIQFISFTTKVNTKGATYDIEAVPYNHGGFLEAGAATTPIKLEVRAKDIAEFFTANEEVVNEIKASNIIKNVLADKVAEYNQRVKPKGPVSDSIRESFMRDEEEIRNLEVAWNNSVAATAEVKSYANAMNQWYVDLIQDGKFDVLNEIKFEFSDDKMWRSLFPDPATLPTSITRMEKVDEKQEGLKTKRWQDGQTMTVIAINQGTSIVDVIGLALRNSEYIRSQLADPDSEMLSVKDGNALQWFKVIPRIKLLNYDNKRNDFAKQFIYRVVPWVIYNTEIPYAPMGMPKGRVKVYNYMFTGKNEDILDFDIQFDALYWTARSAHSANKDSIVKGVDSAQSQDPKIIDKQKQLNNHVKNKYDAANVIPEFRSTQIYVPNAINAVSLSGDSLSDKAALAEQMLSAAGDLLSVNLKIVGDPDFIKQDDIFYADASGSKAQFTPNGSIVMDTGEICIELNFKTPVDYNDRGLADPRDSSYVTSSYSGLYKVLSVTSTFANGKFEQTLETVRLGIQPTQGISGSAASSTVGFGGMSLADSLRPELGGLQLPGDLRVPSLNPDSSTMPNFYVPDITKTLPESGTDIPASVMDSVKDTAATATDKLKLATNTLSTANTALGSGFTNIGAVDVDVVGKLTPFNTNACTADSLANDLKAAFPKYK